MDKSIVVVTEGGPHIWAIVNALANRFGKITVILETPESKKALLTRRAAKQGWVTVAGQLGTMVLVRLGKRFFASRAARIAAENGLETDPQPRQAIIEVPSANSPEFLSSIEKLEPAVVLLAGCRLLSQKTLAAMPCPVLNYHAGITPGYRGMNGGYWALATGDAGNFGATVHLVDAGVDTAACCIRCAAGPERATISRSMRSGSRRCRATYASRAWMTRLRGGSRRQNRICRQSNGIIRRSGSMSGPDWPRACGKLHHFSVCVIFARRF